MTALDDLTALWNELIQTTKGYKQMTQPLVAGTHWFYAQQLKDKLAAELAAPTPVPIPVPTPVPVPAAAPTFRGPFQAADGPWRTPVPADWASYVHPLTPGMVQGVTVGDISNSTNIHAFAYRPVEMQAKFGTNGLTWMKWAGPGVMEAVIYAPNGSPTVTVNVSGTLVPGVPIPSGWTGWTPYLEHRTVIYCENGDMGNLSGVTPPGADGNWHAVTAQKTLGNWAAETAMWGGGGSGIAHGCGLIVPSDIAYAQVHGDFGHVLAFNTSSSADGSFTGIPKGTWPAGKGYAGAPESPNTDGRTTGNAGIPHGARVFFDPTATDTDFAALGITKTWMLWIAHTVQRYGLISKETTSSQGDAGQLMCEGQASVDWNVAHGFYPAGFKWPWKADGTTSLDRDYSTALPPAMFPTGGSRWKVFDWTKPYPGITAP